MTTKKEREHEELLVRISNHAEEIRFVKGQQWRTLYYAILFLAATAFAFQQPINLGEFYIWAKCFGYIAVIVVTIASIIHLLAIKFNLDLYRAASVSMEDELDKLTGISSKLSRAHEPGFQQIRNGTFLPLRWLPIILSDRKRQEKFYNAIFYALFIAIILLSGIAAFFMIRFDD